MSKEKIYEYKKMKVNGAIHHLIRESSTSNWIHHNPEGPAIEPIEKGSKEYYLYGIKKTHDELLEFKREQKGLPWYKGSGANLTRF